MPLFVMNSGQYGKAVVFAQDENQARLRFQDCAHCFEEKNATDFALSAEARLQSLDDIFYKTS